MARGALQQALVSGSDVEAKAVDSMVNWEHPWSMYRSTEVLVKSAVSSCVVSNGDGLGVLTDRHTLISLHLRQSHAGLAHRRTDPTDREKSTD